MKKITLNLVLSLLSLVFVTQINATLPVHEAQHDRAAISVDNPWVRSAPPNAPILGAFMEISNHSDSDIKLLSANTKGYKRLELHKTVSQDGMMKMIKQDFMPIPAHGKLTLKPGGWHIMMIQPKKVPKEGDSVVIKLVFDNGLSKTIQAKVRKGRAMDHKKMMHHQH
ncbi:copper chaperone PCu(A)C [bacterium endosymbiont of Bathymodiolus sp. 5 South]|jgi:copper(I)-binding protein|uniref:copper chaperone PCu(A)C n=1 Tax=bacterium endosymbiont of Bathymodiolus sp. 5 South TaxID=1181670 RepID=UPI0010B206DF|nr:copper chaperone PCu(A)C [bacterium endosymbiont of Bathymodiolus sp. 5 South]CAC9462490.1 Copper metallochaperone, bacterial analog of Cox17 protein [uncultured Gammaproteobacteria bacterium]SHN93160.1 Copper metallochaperone, bacterial analog of Cox17 protein [bacterium endosymbiont of Bathymodiolus sp. 5 South]SSC07717.1 Copper metallochaperone, bacterial analog of Cox17 protein [bacterium endosymbiont of Bathymodiolus sp. 5 South]VVH57424.1 Copper metallochaperone, bacterial analog of Co